MERDCASRGGPLMHPCLRAMIESGGMTVREYVDLTATCRSYRTASGVGQSDTRIVPMPGLPVHTGGYTHLDEIMVSVHLANEVRFISRAPGEGACLMVDRRTLSETVGSAAVGRHVGGIAGHPMFDVEDLVIAGIDECGPPHPGQIRIVLARVPWLRAN